MDTAFPKSFRVIAILQLCLVFTLISWHMGYPFMGKLFATKSKKQLVQTIMGVVKSDDPVTQSKMTRNQDRFETLPTNHQLTLYRYLEELKLKSKDTFWKKLSHSIHILAFEISPIEQMWIVFSILVPLLFLMNVDGARQAALLLPLIVACYSLDNYWNGYKNLSQEEHLFPTEKQIIESYIKVPFDQRIRMQREQLQSGWHLYLIDKWAKEIPSENPVLRTMQIEKGEYFFQTARALAQASQPPQVEELSFRLKRPFALLLIYLSWNLFFAWYVNRDKMRLDFCIKRY